MIGVCATGVWAAVLAGPSPQPAGLAQLFGLCVRAALDPGISQALSARDALSLVALLVIGLVGAAAVLGDRG